MARRIVIGITGASGMIYARRLLHILGNTDIELYIVISNAAHGIIEVELGSGKVYQRNRYLSQVFLLLR